jgi:hypothetical protein
MVYTKQPKVGVVEKKRHEDQRNLTTLVVCFLGFLGYMNNEQNGISTQLEMVGVYVSTDYQVLLKYISLF